MRRIFQRLNLVVRVGRRALPAYVKDSASWDLESPSHERKMVAIKVNQAIYGKVALNTNW